MGTRAALTVLLGNTSDVVVVELEQPGGCAQTSTSTSLAFSLGAVLFARRRRGDAK